MQTLLSAVATAACALGIVYAFLSQRGSPREATSVWFPRFLTYAALLSIVLFLMTVPSESPFSPGMTLGWGFLAGAAASLLGFVAFGNGRSAEHAATIGALSLGALGPAVMLLAFPGYPTEALIGCALGATLPAVLCAGLMLGREQERVGCTFLEWLALAAVISAAGAWLGMEHFPRLVPGSAAGGYWAVPALTVAAGALGLALSGGLDDQRSTLLPGLLAGVVAILVVAALQWRMLPELHWSVPVFGVVAIGLIRSALASDDARPVALAAGSVLVALALTALAFRTLQGYGQALALAAALPLVAVTKPHEASPMLRPLLLGAFVVAILLMLYRVFLEGAGRGYELDFQQTYNILALILGLGAAFAVLLLAGNTEGSTAHADVEPATGAFVRAAGMGFVAAVAPVLVAAVLGLRAEGAFLVGLILAETVWMLMAAWSTGADRKAALSAVPHALLAVGFLSAVQFTPLMLSFSWTRAARASLVAVVGVVVLLGLMWDARSHKDMRQEAGHDSAA